MTEPEHPGYAPLDEPEGSGIGTADTYLYKVQDQRLTVLCPACVRQMRTNGKQVLVLRDSDNECIVCSSGRANE